jgi:hypothetical protein
MSDGESFLGRWSRRKQQAADEAAAPKPAPSPADSAAPSGHSGPAPVRRDTSGAAQAAPAPAFDVASLPSLDSITAASDVRAFLAPGVPMHLTRAALRRAWAADPAIRDFVGLQENAWDFTDPSAVPGFGELSPDCDIKALLREAFGEPAEEPEGSASASPAAPARREAQPSPSAEESPPSSEPVAATSLPDGADSAPTRAPEALARHASASGSNQMVQRENDAAMQNDHRRQQSATPKPRRYHGGALPA